jgi:hypothetical protein
MIVWKQRSGQERNEMILKEIGREGVEWIYLADNFTRDNRRKVFIKGKTFADMAFQRCVEFRVLIFNLLHLVSDRSFFPITVARTELPTSTFYYFV